MTNQYYEFRVDGTLSARARDVFCDMDLEETRPGLVLRGTVMDDSHLHGILEQIRALGLTVVSGPPCRSLPRRPGPVTAGRPPVPVRARPIRVMPSPLRRTPLGGDRPDHVRSST